MDILPIGRMTHEKTSSIVDEGPINALFYIKPFE